VLAGVKLIAEPWDCGPGGYQVGGFPPGWAEWNDKYRDTVRDYWRGEAAAAALAPRLLGSPDMFDRFGRRPYASINFITAHDGYTLNDLVSYNDRHNEANGENNNDGHSHNRSWNCGAEGPTDDAEIKKLRQRQQRNFLGMLLLSQGTPMLLAGDEFGHTQQGNNNAYCQDNEISWLEWQRSADNEALISFVRQLTAMRKKYPILRRNRFLSGDAVNERIDIREITWIHASGNEMTQEQWQDGLMKCFGMVLDGRAQPTGIKQRGQDATLLLIFNAYHDVVNFILPEFGEHAHWKLVIDTNIPDLGENGEAFDPKHEYQTTGRSLLVFALKA
jgi:glycogen operon protein